jgi:hypothetical protein
MPVACPHCQSSVEQADLNAQEILCPACGFSFRLERDSTVDWASSRGPRTLGKFELIEAIGPVARGQGAADLPGTDGIEQDAVAADQVEDGEV